MSWEFWVTLGIISGFTTSVLFIRMEKSFWDKVTTWGPNFGVLAFTAYTQWAQNVIASQEIAYYFIFQSLGWISSFFLTIYIYCLNHKKYGVNFGDVIGGIHLALINDKINNIEASNRLKTASEKETNIAKEQAKIDQEKNELKALKKESICLQVTSEEKVPVYQLHTNNCPSYARRVVDTVGFIKNACEESLSELLNNINRLGDSDKVPMEIMATTRVLLQLVSVYINKHLIRDDGCRVHFRLQCNGGAYKKFVATIGSDPHDYLEPLKIIKYQGSMIERSFNTGSPALKSLNPSYHQAGTHDASWPEYITIAFNELTINQLPLVSMGISFPHENNFTELGKYLCQIRFDWILKDSLKEYFEFVNTQDYAVKAATINKMQAI